MKRTIFLTCLACFLTYNSGYAETCEPYEACDPDKTYAEIYGSCNPWGATEHYNCYKRDSEESATLKVFDCKCPTTYKKIYSEVSGCTGLTYVSGCRCECSNCQSDTTWSAGNTGYQRRLIRTCDCSGSTATCKSNYEYRCAVGYYGSSTNGTSGCTRCPASGGIYGTTAAAGSTVITSCYIPSGSSFSDSTGSGTYTGNCYYKN